MEKVIYNPALNSGNGISGILDTLRSRYAQHQTYRQTMRELSSLSDRGLADLGLSRSMIPDLAREAAYGK